MTRHTPGEGAGAVAGGAGLTERAGFTAGVGWGAVTVGATGAWCTSPGLRRTLNSRMTNSRIATPASIHFGKPSVNGGATSLGVRATAGSAIAVGAGGVAGTRATVATAQAFGAVTPA